MKTMYSAVFVGVVGAWSIDASMYAASEVVGLDTTDTKIVLRIGPNEVSAYGLDKNFIRFEQSSRGSAELASSSDSKLQWFELFLAKQVAIAEALSAGYHTRPETLRIVEKMERHMLSQADGPLYQKLQPPNIVSAEDLSGLYNQTAYVVDVVGVRMPANQAADLGADWPALDTAGRLTRLKQLQNTKPYILFYEGPLAWPRDPFPEMAEALMGGHAGSWLEKITPDNVMVLYIKSARILELPPLAEQREAFTKRVERRKLQDFRAARKSRLLKEARLVIHEHALQPMADVLRFIEAPDVSLNRLAAFTSEELATYFLGDEKVTMTVAGWCERFNQQLIRRTPANPSELRTNIEDLIMVDLDVAEARRLQLDKEARFVEDRRNFMHYQALELYEKERLVPQINISEAEVDAYRTAHITDYSAVVEVRGLSLRFGTREDASAWAARHREVTDDALLSPDITSRSGWTLARKHPAPELARVIEPLFRIGDRSSFGPVQTPEGWTVFVRLSSAGEPLPLPVVESRIRQVLTRKRLDEVEIRHAREMARKYEVIDNIDYAKYGLSATPEKPWAPK